MPFRQTNTICLFVLLCALCVFFVLLVTLKGVFFFVLLVTLESVCFFFLFCYQLKMSHGQHPIPGKIILDPPLNTNASKGWHKA